MPGRDATLNTVERRKYGHQRTMKIWPYFKRGTVRFRFRAIDEIIDGQVVGHMSQALASSEQGQGSFAKQRLKLLEKTVSRGGGYGMEVLCSYGAAEIHQNAKEPIDLENNLSVRVFHEPNSKKEGA